MNVIERGKRLPSWVKAAICVCILVIVAGLLSTWALGSFFTSSLGSFLSNIIAEAVGIVIGVLLVTWALNSYLERSRLSRLAEQRKPYLKHIEMSLRVSISALCMELNCPLIPKPALRDGTGTQGKEDEIVEWFKGIKQGVSLPNVSQSGVPRCLRHIETHGMGTAVDQMRAIAYLFEDEPSVVQRLFNAAHNTFTMRVYFSSRGTNPLAPDDIKKLGDLGLDLAELLRDTSVLLKHQQR